MDVASDCQTVVQGAGFFKSPEKNPFLSHCDNQDFMGSSRGRIARRYPDF